MSIIKCPENIPQNPGVYTFRKGGTLLYIGKAENLKSRLLSYFRKDVGWKARKLLEEATKIEWIVTPSEIEALLKESELVKKYQPKFNYQLRDDKNYFYVSITKDKFPRIFLTHQLAGKNKYLGPFTSGSAIRSALRILRRIFPYCTCKKPHKRPCLNSEIGRCLGFCCDKSKLQITNYKLQKEYLGNIKNLFAVLNGEKKGLVIKLEKDMRTASRNQEYERAARLRDQMLGLENIFLHSRLPHYRGLTSIETWRRIERNIAVLVGTKKRISRVEGYDISNISGTEATGSMVVFIDGVPAKSEYRKFKIKTVRGPNDTEMLKEVIRRRLAHPEWKYPDLMLIDGGRAQLNAAKSQITNHKSQTLVVSLAKREEELYTEKRKRPIKLSLLPTETAFFFQRVRDESHRFAKKYHHKLREISYRKN